MILNEKKIPLGRGTTRTSILKVVGRETKTVNNRIFDDWLLVEYNGETHKVSAGFFGRVDKDFKIGEKAKIIHMITQDGLGEKHLRFPIFDGFYYE